MVSVKNRSRHPLRGWCRLPRPSNGLDPSIAKQLISRLFFVRQSQTQYTDADIYQTAKPAVPPLLQFQARAWLLLAAAVSRSEPSTPIASVPNLLFRNFLFPYS